MDEETKQRIEEIRKRLEEYKKHKNDLPPFISPSYFTDAEKAKSLEASFPEDIEFLLNELRRLRALTTLRHSPSRISEK